MTHFADLTPYGYADRPEPGTRNVGWLGDGPIPPGQRLSEALIERLAQHCVVAVHQMRGYHRCPACDADPVELRVGEERVLLGSAEIRVFDERGDAFAAPNLIHHYVQAHDYRPPDAFLRALTHGPAPFTAAYLASLTRLGHSWRPPHRRLLLTHEAARERVRRALAEATGDAVSLLEEPGTEKHYGWVFRYPSTVGSDTRTAAIVAGFFVSWKTKYFISSTAPAVVLTCRKLSSVR